MGLMALREKKTYTDKTKLNPVACDNTLRCKDTKRCALNQEEEEVSCAGCCVKSSGPGGRSEVKNDINTVQFLAQTDCFVSLYLNVSSRAAGFN